MKTAGKGLATISVFAILHAVVTILARWLGLSDQLMLTTLTMIMAVALCELKRTNVTTMIATLVIVNFGGYYLGRYIGRVLRLFLENTYVIGGITTFSATMIIGLSVFLTISWTTKNRKRKARKEISIYWLMLIFTVIIIARLALILVTKENIYKENVRINVIVDYTFSLLAMLYLAVNIVKVSRKEQKTKEKSDMVQYNYLRLQQQVKPHFMFNNLNILNNLICEKQMKEASDFVYRLAYLYRYMIENEDENLVTLEEELEFVNRYTDLMKVRFESSFSVEIDIDDKILKTLVVPCSIQLLIENALKHNGGTTQTPLKIRIYNTETDIVICNNKLKKNSLEPSTHLGLKYITELYQDLSEKKVKKEEDYKEFTVRLPIIS